MMLSVAALRGLRMVADAEEAGMPILYRPGPDKGMHPRVLACISTDGERLITISMLRSLPGHTRRRRVWEVTAFGHLVLAEWAARQGSRAMSLDRLCRDPKGA